jgi:hypothetical protein
MRKKISRRVCQYFVRFIEADKAGAVPVRAVTSQNEVDIQLGRRCQARLEDQADKPKRSILVFAHYAKAVRCDAQVIATISTLLDIEHVAFANHDRDYVLLLTNQGGKGRSAAYSKESV